MADGWRKRLAGALKEKKLSWNKASLCAGLSHGYIHGLLSDGKEPTLENFEAICAGNGLSVTEILLGLNLNAESEKILQALAELPKDRRDALVSFLLGDRPGQS